MTQPKMSLVEVFRSPQGEGYNAGRDAVFVRFAGCNLSCVFAEGAVCDTPYQHANIKVTLEDLFEAEVAVWRVRPPPPLMLSVTMLRDRPMLILTGGEPTMAPMFDQVVHEAKDRGFYVAVESNGTHWRDGLMHAHWVTISPKGSVQQGSPAPLHNHRPQSAELDRRVIDWMVGTAGESGEYRYVISGLGDEVPEFLPAFRHYLSPAVKSDGMGQEWRTGFPGFVDGAVERCLEIVQADARWRISVQTHKFLGVR